MGILSKAVSERVQGPARLVVYALEGWGKSTLGANTEKPIFADVEGGIDQINVPAVKTSSNADMFALVHDLQKSKHDYKTLVIDSIDAYEKILIQDTCKEHEKRNMEDFGFGRGFSYVESKIRVLLKEFDLLARNGMQIVILAHADIGSHTDPGEATYSRYQMRLNKRSANALLEWCDACLFGTLDIVKEKNSAVLKSDSKRIFKTSSCASMQAKNRYKMPEEIEGSWKSIRKYIPNVMDFGRQDTQAAYDLAEEEEEDKANDEETELNDNHMRFLQFETKVKPRLIDVSQYCEKTFKVDKIQNLSPTIIQKCLDRFSSFMGAVDDFCKKRDEEYKEFTQRLDKRIEEWDNPEETEVGEEPKDAKTGKEDISKA